MTKQNFRNHVLISSILTILAIAVIVVFCMNVFRTYSIPNENNTYIATDSVTEVYYTVPGERVVVISLADGEPVKLVSPYWLGRLYSHIGYDVEELADLLEGETIQYRRMNDLPWATEIYVDDVKIDNTKLTTQQVYASWIGIGMVGCITTGLVVYGDVEYVKSKYDSYQRAERKRIKKAKREQQLQLKRENKTV